MTALKPVPLGPWLVEPTLANLTDPTTGLRLALRRGPGGHWCGYVRVPESHPWFGKDYDWPQPMPTGWLDDHKVSLDEIGALNFLCASAHDLDSGAPLNFLVPCHGGLTFSGEAEWIGPGWWLGFDCAHSGDVTPRWPRDYDPEAIYRNYPYVIEACRKLASAIHKFA